MAASAPALQTNITGDRLNLTASGAWTTAHAGAAEQLVRGVAGTLAQARSVTIDMAAVQELDTLGAWLLERLVRGGRDQGREVRFGSLPERYRGLLDEVAQVNRGRPAQLRPLNRAVAILNATGAATVGLWPMITAFLDMLGALGDSLARAIMHPRSFRFTSTVHFIYRVGWQAIPIILLITLLIGAIIAQQGFFHLRKFGADSYAVDMVGILVLRELGVLIVAIMVAGRSGSAYTAELGSMKMREEIDALRTMGFDPVDVLILPRVLALIVALPILTFIGSMAALYGGGLVAWLYGDMSPAIYIARLHEAVSVTHFKVGIIKAPFMALVIGVVACSEGLMVRGSAESLGLHTTTSVVKSIFLVIVLDGFFAIFFASIGM
ncbi:MAG TPA: MlaE family lipid ABC transporter permease subunit [Xanthobacteraceae bacterium]|nr:MlaE family lipid ABC transporter permease subunit [Xanthobacteraceae bacterium]